MGRRGGLLSRGFGIDTRVEWVMVGSIYHSDKLVMD